jgi:DNA repair protein RadA/Sms
VVRGVNYNKVQLLLAVLQKQLSIPVDRYDVFVNVVGGIDIKSPASDLALTASVFSAFKNIPVAKQILFTGEVGLLGEVRPGAFESKIISEAKRLKFKQIYSSKNIKNIRELPRILTSK